MLGERDQAEVARLTDVATSDGAAPNVEGAASSSSTAGSKAKSKASDPTKQNAAKAVSGFFD